MSRATILVTGATRGLGKATVLELARLGNNVIATGRSTEDLAKLKHEAEQQGLSITTLQMDVSDDHSVEKAVDHLSRELVCLDCLVNNAGVILESGDYFPELPLQTIIDTLNINTLGPIRTMQGFKPLLQKSANPRVVNISSGMGVMEGMEQGYSAYRMSKAALNVASLQAHYAYHQSDGIRVLSVCPGWVKTDMGGAEAAREIDQGIAGIIWAINTPADGPSGQFFRDNKPIPW